MKKNMSLLFVCFLVSFFIKNSLATPLFDLYLGAPYITNPLGEGKNTLYAPAPLIREDGFDCTTYVETVLAHHKATKESHNDVQTILQNIRYLDGKIDFFSRAHFMEYQWIPNALKHHFIEVYPFEKTNESRVQLNLQEWFLKNPTVLNKDKTYIQAAQKQPTHIQASIPYLSPHDITPEFIQGLPEFMVVFLLKDIPPNSWIGQKEQQLLVTHMGLLKNHTFYHASSKEQKVCDVDLVRYLQEKQDVAGVSFYTVR